MTIQQKTLPAQEVSILRPRGQTRVEFSYFSLSFRYKEKFPALMFSLHLPWPRQPCKTLSSFKKSEFPTPEVKNRLTPELLVEVIAGSIR